MTIKKITYNPAPATKPIAWFKALPWSFLPPWTFNSGIEIIHFLTACKNPMVDYYRYKKKKKGVRKKKKKIKIKKGKKKKVSDILQSKVQIYIYLFKWGQVWRFIGIPFMFSRKLTESYFLFSHDDSIHNCYG